LDPKTASRNLKLFKDHRECVNVPYLKRQLVQVALVDVVWDAYKAIRLTVSKHTSEERGTGEAPRVSDKTQFPHNWKSFLRVKSNKIGIFRFLATVMEFKFKVPEKMLIRTKGQNVSFSATL
jgi:hypothetical protein